MPSTSIYGQALDAVKAEIEELAVITSTSIVIQEVAHRVNDFPKPYISVSPYGPERMPSGTNLREGVGYPILVAYIADPDVSSLDARLLIRQKIRRRFHQQKLTGISASNVGEVNTTVEPMNVVEPANFINADLFTSALLVIVEVREPKS